MDLIARLTNALYSALSLFDPSQTMEATVTRAMLIPVETSTQKYVGGGIG